MTEFDLAKIRGGGITPFNDTLNQDGDNVHVQCLNSTDFVVGKQTNFNGPVTIINAPAPQFDFSEKVIIRDQIWTTATATALEKEAKKHDTHNGHSNEFTDINLGPPPNVSPAPTAQPSKPVLPNFKNLSAMSGTSFLGLPILLWVISAVLAISCLVALSVGLTNDTLSDDGLTHHKDYIGDTNHSLYKREDWGALNASSKIAIIEPVPYVVISHTAGRFCYETATCQSVLRGIQKYHMSRNPPFADIAYNFMVGGDGYIYEGRGWGIRSTHQGFSNNRNIDITFIGDFSVYDEPTPTQIDAVKKLIEYGVENCHVHQNYTLIAHNSTSSTLSPGKNIYRIISTWDHFDPDPKAHLPRKFGETTACKPHGPHLILKELEKNGTDI